MRSPNDSLSVIEAGLAAKLETSKAQTAFTMSFPELKRFNSYIHFTFTQLSDLERFDSTVGSRFEPG